MSRSRQELERRVTELEATLGTAASAAGLAARLAAIEAAVRQLRAGDPELAEADEALARCGDLIEAHVPVGTELAVVSAADPSVTDLQRRPVTILPYAGGRDAEEPVAQDSAGQIARLEATRVRGAGFLLVPSADRPWLKSYPEVAEHLLSRYAVAADEPDIGLLVDLRARRTAAEGPQTLAEVLTGLAHGERFVPVLDWTEADLAALIADQYVFAPPAPTNGALPYIDRTIPVVVVDDPERVEEGRRIASTAVVLVELDAEALPEVVSVEAVAESAAESASTTVVIGGGEIDKRWVTWVEEALIDQPLVSVVAGGPTWPEAASAEADAAVLLGRGVLPLPGCIEAVTAALLADDAVGAATGKLLNREGRLEAAGTIVFADGSAVGVGVGSEDVAAPWHEYVRPVCAGTGMLAVRPSVIREVAAETASLGALGARIWEAGHEVRYQPDARAVLTGESSADDPDPELARAWGPALGGRPDRPTLLDSTAWRVLLAGDDSEGCWR